MNTKKATPKNEAAPSPKAKNNINIISCPRQKRVLIRLIKASTTVRELLGVAGNNPAETIRQLRNRGLFISLSWHKGRDQDGKPCRYGEYCLDTGSLTKAKAMLGSD
ncbi:helix-turn-helix domain-containing protein [Leucothrix pacifica]|nr:helix-turn-helix domain-containing protein [Leucothrix pacifica]